MGYTLHPDLRQLESCLRPQDRPLWLDYLNLENAGRRKQAQESLNKLIQALSGYSEDERSIWVSRFCFIVLADSNGDRAYYQTRYPLFLKVIAPELLKRYGEKRAQAALWLYRLVEQFSWTPELESLFDKYGVPFWREGLLNKGLEYEPENSPLRRQLIHHLANSFADAVHELPSGVLVRGGMDAGTPDDYRAMLQDLEKLDMLVRAEALEDTYADNIEFWRQHTAGYLDYIGHRGSYDGYADYIAKHHLPLM